MQSEDKLVGNQPDFRLIRGAAKDEALSLPAIQPALYGAVSFAEHTLAAAGVFGAGLSRLICTPDARHWTLGFGERFFEVEVLPDGFSVRWLLPSQRAARPLERGA